MPSYANRPASLSRNWRRIINVRITHYPRYRVAGASPEWSASENGRTMGWVALFAIAVDESSSHQQEAMELPLRRCGGPLRPDLARLGKSCGSCLPWTNSDTAIGSRKGRARRVERWACVRNGTPLMCRGSGPRRAVSHLCEPSGGVSRTTLYGTQEVGTFTQLWN